MARIPKEQVDYSGGASGAVGAGSTTTPGGARAASRGAAVLFTHTFVFAATGTPLPCPGFVVPPGCQVRVRGPLANGHAAYAAEYREKLLSGAAIPIGAGDDVQFQLDNLANLWLMGTVNDSLAVTVQTVPAAV